MELAACLLWLAALCPRLIHAAPVSQQIPEGEMFTFQCAYDKYKDTYDSNELAVSVSDCSKTPQLVYDLNNLQVIAAVFGTVSFMPGWPIQKKFPDKKPPMVYVNKENEMYKKLYVTITKEETKNLHATIKAVKETDGLCAYCLQVDIGSSYSETKKTKITMVAQPKAKMQVNDKDLSSNSLQVKRDEAVKLSCSSEGSLEVRAEIYKVTQGSGKQLVGENGVLNLAKVAPEDAATYECVVTSSNNILIKFGKHTSKVEVILKVLFAPLFDVEEVIRYTTTGDIRENIQISARAFPEPSMTCNDLDTSETAIKEQYESNTFFSTFKVTLLKLNKEAKKRTVLCKATNTEGHDTIKVTVTAFPPVPKIVSNNSTMWYNSYNLKWTHDEAQANIKSYKVTVTYLDDEGKIVNETVHEVHPETGSDEVKLLKPLDEGKQRTHNGIVYSLVPNSKHKIKVSACSHSDDCKDSEEIQVKTAIQDAKYYNDPKQDIRQVLSDPDNGQPPVPCLSPLLLLMVTLRLLL